MDAFVAVPSQTVSSPSLSRSAVWSSANAAPPALGPMQKSTGVLNSMVAAGSLCIACVASATQRNRRTRNPRSTGMHAFEQELGVTLPLGYWDPMGLASDGDQEAFRRRRAAEIKNGRVGMIATLGYIGPEYFRWPGEISPSLSLKFQNIPSGLAALYKIPAEGWAQMGVLVAFLELFPLRQEEYRAPGDYATCGRLGIPWFYVAGKHRQTYSTEDAVRDVNKMDPIANMRSLNAEINNGRLAMFSIAGMVAQNAFIGTTGPDMWIP